MITFTNLHPLQQPFAEVTLEVTLQMSHSKVPTIPFVLPLYQKMEHHLKAVSFSLEHSFKVQHAAEKGLEKLRKYSAPAKLHHTYILGTGKSSHPRNQRHTNQPFYFAVLHPCLRSHWFEALKGPDNAAAQREAITNAEVVFRYVAETYLETSPASTPSTVPRPQPVTKTSSFLQVARACSFQRPITAATSIPTSKRTPKEELDEELTRYFSFESEPIERQEGEEGSHEEPTAQEVLLNPLLGWKVRAGALFICLNPSDNQLRKMPLNFLQSLGWLRTTLLFLPLVSLLSESS